ncbi:hypothetical protein [Tsuneonella mangrovi]|uniref:hypothetical protein n=1 Tax=Tsuneonella mangrovi TaxID=1982042 RepID=UPI0012376055|nr:hypothetical protein [Tsuneonella mangrovi]
MADTDETRRAAWPLLGLFALVFAALFAATFALPHDRYIRYQQLLPTLQFRTVWGYERIAFDKIPIDIAIVGNSRLQAGVRAPLLQAKLGKALGRPVHVANLSLPQEGDDAHYVIVKQLLRDHPEVKLIVLSAIGQMPREAHPAFRDMADARDIAAAPVLINSAYFTNLAAVPYRQMALFVQTLFPHAFGDRVRFDRAHYAGTDFDTTRSFASPTGRYVDRDAVHTAAELRPGADARMNSIAPPLLPPSLADYEFAIERTYTPRIARLAKANGTKVVFLYTPVFAHAVPVKGANFYRRFGPLLQADFLAQDPRNYSDYAHSNRIGSARLTGWLAGQIVDRRLLEATPLPTEKGR